MKSTVQVQIVRLLDKYQGEPLTVREIAEGIHRSISTTHKTLAKLKQKGFITWKENYGRLIRLVEL